MSMLPWVQDQTMFNVSAGATVLSGYHIESFIAQSTGAITEGDIFGYLLDTYTSVIPEPILALLIFAPIGVAFYMVQRSFFVPLVMMMLIGSVVIVEFPIAFQNALVAGITIMILVLLFVVLQRIRVQ